MHINSISANSINNIKQNNQNFKGLWGKTSEQADIDTVLGVSKVEDTHYYYPFLGETNEEIEQVVKDNSSAVIEPVGNTQRYRLELCKVCTRIPCTKADYEKYSKLNYRAAITPEIKAIHDAVKDKYVTNEYSVSQKSAVNSEIARKIFDTDA